MKGCFSGAGNLRHIIQNLQLFCLHTPLSVLGRTSQPYSRTLSLSLSLSLFLSCSVCVTLPPPRILYCCVVRRTQWTASFDDVYMHHMHELSHAHRHKHHHTPHTCWHGSESGNPPTILRVDPPFLPPRSCCDRCPACLSNFPIPEYLWSSWDYYACVSSTPL